MQLLKNHKIIIRLLLTLLIVNLTLQAQNKTIDTINAPEIDLEDASNKPVKQNNETNNQASNDNLPAIDKLPEIVKKVDAVYPPQALKNGIQGTVVMDLVIDTLGAIDSIAVVKGVDPYLDTAAVKAVSQYKFSPALSQGKPIPVLMQYEYPFTIKEVTEKISKYVNFSGRVVERGTRTPIADAMVVITFLDTTADKSINVPFSSYRNQIGQFDGQYLEEDKLVTLTDSLGNFKFYSLPVGLIQVTIPLANYDEFKETEQIQASEATEATYYVAKTEYSEYEIVVYGKVEKTKEVVKRQLTLQEVKKIPGFGGDAVKVVQALPGVARATFGMSDIIVRGAPTTDSKFFLDGVEIPLLFHFGVRSTYNSEALQSVDFYPGGFGTRYGEVTAGVIEITGREAKKDRWHGYADVNFVDGALFFEGPITKNISTIIQGRRSFIGDLITAATKSMKDQFILTTAPFYWDYLCRTDYNISKKQHAYLTLFGVNDAFKLVSSEVRGGSSAISEAKNSIDSEVRFYMTLLGYDYDLNDKYSNSLRLSHTYGRNRINAFGTFAAVQKAQFFNMREQFTYAPLKKLKVNIGTEIKLYPVEVEVASLDWQNLIHRDTIDDEVFGIAGFYLNSEIRPIDRLEIIPGIRYDYYPQLDYYGNLLPAFWNYKNSNLTTRFAGEPSLRISAKYSLNDKHAIKGSVGNYNQTPQPLGQTTMDPWGDPKMSTTQAAQYTLGHEWKITDLVNLDIQLYRNKKWFVPEFSSAEDSKNGSKPMVALGQRRMKGMELMLRHERSTHFFGWIAYSLAKSEYLDREKNAWYLTSNDQTHNLIAVGSWKLPDNWDVGGKFQLTSGNPYSGIIDYYFFENEDDFVVKTGIPNNKRLPVSAQLDLRIDKKYVYKTWMMSWYIDFMNIGYFLYKSPQIRIVDPVDPLDKRTNKENSKYVYQPSYPSVGIRAEF